jgi:hypothetical protein
MHVAASFSKEKALFLYITSMGPPHWRKSFGYLLESSKQIWIVNISLAPNHRCMQLESIIKRNHVGGFSFFKLVDPSIVVILLWRQRVLLRLRVGGWGGKW